MAEDALASARAEAAAGRTGAAIATLRRLIARQPKNAAAQMQLAQLLLGEGQTEQALFAAGRAAEVSPRDAEALNTLGYVQMRSGLKEEAARTLGRAIEAAPTHLAALSNLAGCLRGMGKLDEAAAVFERLLAAHPDNEFAYADANLILQMGMAREAAACLRKATARFPQSVWLKRDLCVGLNYTDDATAGELLHAHAGLGRMMGAPGEVAAVDTNPERVVRVGIVSADLREHSVAWFVRPLLALGEGFEVVVYSGAGKDDEVARELRGIVREAGRWKEVSRLSNPALGEMIRKESIDIAIDLGGWTAGSRLFALANRAAPVQISYLGYPNTTGLKAIDYRIVDSATDPEGAEALATERLIRLDPCFVCYRPPGDAPGIGGEAPIVQSHDRRHGGVTFGSFNSIKKLTPTTAGLWAAALKAVPRSRLRIKSPGLSSERARRHIGEMLGAAGIEAERVELMDRVASRAEHLGLYGRVDVALDTFPYHGTTTTCEALWMGVPVVTLVGKEHRSRVGASLLRAIGRGEWTAGTVEEFAAVAAGLAGDRARLSEERRTLRERVRGSALCDEAAFGARLAGALREVWRRTCSAVK